MHHMSILFFFSMGSMFIVSPGQFTPHHCKQAVTSSEKRPCLSPMCLSVCGFLFIGWSIFQLAGICFTLVTHLHLRPDKSTDLLLSEACGSFTPPDGLTYVLNVHPEGQLSGLKGDDHPCNQRVWESSRLKGFWRSHTVCLALTSVIDTHKQTVCEIPTVWCHGATFITSLSLTPSVALSFLLSFPAIVCLESTHFTYIKDPFLSPPQFKPAGCWQCVSEDLRWR